jgi:hypothetical protein
LFLPEMSKSKSFDEKLDKIQFLFLTVRLLSHPETDFVKLFSTVIYNAALCNAPLYVYSSPVNNKLD